MKRRGFLKTVCGVIGAGLAWPLLGKGTAGPRDIVVRPGQTVRLPPGQYGTVTVMGGGTVHCKESRIETVNLYRGAGGMIANCHIQGGVTYHDTVPLLSWTREGRDV